MYTLQQTKDLLNIAKGISDQIDKEHAYYSELFEDFQGYNKGLCNALDTLIDTLDKDLGNNDWINWWVFESNFGANQMEAGTGGGDALVLVDSVDKLYELILKDMDA